VLNSSEIVKQYEKLFAIVEIDFKYQQRRGEVDKDEKRPEVARYNPQQLRPVMVILDGEGRQVFKGFGGFNNSYEAELLAKYVSGKHYRNTEWPAFIAANMR